ncbi:MAG: PadR family transcriptional regulator [Candidatus Acidiferrales bacterium]
MNDLIVLVTLWDGPKHGYRLKKEAGQILGLIDLHNNLIYPLLRRFAAKRLVSKKTVPGKRGQTRQLYALTALGRRTVIRRLSEYNDRDARSPEGFCYASECSRPSRALRGNAFSTSAKESYASEMNRCHESRAS